MKKELNTNEMSVLSAGWTSGSKFWDDFACGMGGAVNGGIIGAMIGGPVGWVVGTVAGTLISMGCSAGAEMDREL